MKSGLISSALAELIGTFVLVFVGAAAVTIAGDHGGVVVVALAHGLILAAIVYMYGHISGAHVNPAVTAGLLIGRQMTIIRAVVYWVAQFAGGIIAALVLSMLIPSGTNLGQTTGSLTAGHVWQAAAFEGIMTFFLVSTVFQAAAYGKAGILAGVAIGFTLAGSILAGGVYTGASLNPARTLGPALVAGDTSYLVPYLVGIFGGGIVAGIVHGYFFKPGR